MIIHDEKLGDYCTGQSHICGTISCSNKEPHNSNRTCEYCYFVICKYPHISGICVVHKTILLDGVCFDCEQTNKQTGSAFAQDLSGDIDDEKIWCGSFFVDKK